MTKIVWDESGKHFYETGLDHGVLYPVGEKGKYGQGVPWNGLISVSEKPSGAEPNPLYADNIKYLDLMSAEEFSASVEAYTYPEEFEACDGTAYPVAGAAIGQQARKAFGLVYRTKVGNDTDGQDHGYKIHILYNCKASPSEKSYSTVNDSPEAITFSWELSTTPVPVKDHSPTATLILDSRKIQAETLKKVEDKLFGSDSEEPTFLLPDEVIELMKAGA